MADFELRGIPGEAAKVFQPFAQELLTKFSSRLLSLSVTGSCITGDFVPGRSDINSVLALTQTICQSSISLLPCPVIKKTASIARSL